MRSMAVQDVQLLVITEESSKGGRGGLFERFIAKLLASEYGFENPTTRTLNVTSEGIELDVFAKHKLTGSTAVAECKADLPMSRRPERQSWGLQRCFTPGVF
jgi:hypothetical protein